MKTVNYTPKTRPCIDSKLRVGHIVVVEAEHPVRMSRIVTVGSVNSRRTIFGRYTWQESTDQEWPLGTFRGTGKMDKAV